MEQSRAVSPLAILYLQKVAVLLVMLVQQGGDAAGGAK